MSSGSSEVDVIRTRIPAYDDDNIVLYAYEPNTAYFSNQETAVSDTSFNEEQTTIQDILVYCQAIYDAIQDLDKKFDVIHGKVSKIHRSRCRVKSKWQSRPSMHDTSPPYTLDTYAPTSPVRNNPDFFQENIPEDPSTWSVDEVIMFLQDVDPQTLDPLVDLFRNHRIDGKALLLLRSDMMIKYMGLKVGTALKICHYIDRLKKEGYIPNS
ncbi:sex comb on midleg-like protein 1 isoform X5 [Bubalus bubalis]|uniref:sex comb on midleg-like protein 1 isoform X5 n=1 Tax=Bubalus bubalis TaxID=89462 RepID=UPI000DBC5A41|nr:sex comb on midleg-like protein 1 isoform X5 [Bubalus bubalis]